MMRRRVSTGVASLGVLLVLQMPLASIAAGAWSGASRHDAHVAESALHRSAVAHSPRVQAKMYAQAIHGLTGPKIQALNQLCGKADPTRTCVPTTAWLRNALDRRVSGFGVTITWVDAAVPDSTDFWVLAPIRFHQHEARFRFHYEETITMGCVSNGNRAWTWTRGVWHLTGGGSSTGCP